MVFLSALASLIHPSVSAFFIDFNTSFATLGNSLYRPSMKAVISSTMTFRFRGRVHLHQLTQGTLQHNARKPAAPFRPEESRDGLERLRDAPSNCTRLWCSNYPQCTRKIFPEKEKCVAQADTIGRLTRSSASAKSSTSVLASWSFSPAPQSNHSNSSNVSHTVRSAPPFLPSAPSQPT